MDSVHGERTFGALFVCLDRESPIHCGLRVLATSTRRGVAGFWIGGMVTRCCPNDRNHPGVAERRHHWYWGIGWLAAARASRARVGVHDQGSIRVGAAPYLHRVVPARVLCAHDDRDTICVLVDERRLSNSWDPLRGKEPGSSV